MEAFWSLENSSNVDYMFTSNQYVLLLIGVVFVAFFSIYFVRKSFPVQKIFVLVIIIFLILFEASSLIWRYFYLKHNEQSINFLSVTNLNFSTLCIWFTILISIFALFYKKHQSKEMHFLTFIFSVASLICFISLIYPVGLNANFEFYHCSNLFFTLSRSFVILLGVSFTSSNWISVNKFTDIWKGLFSLILFGIICFVLGKILGGNSNLLFSNNFPLFDNLGMNVPSPFHYVILGIFIFIFQQILYIPFKIYNYYKMKR